MEAVMAEYAANRVPVDEFRGRDVIEWDSITECAEFHGMSLESLKFIIHCGGCPDGYSMFDLPYGTPFQTRLVAKRAVEIINTETGEVISAAVIRQARRKASNA
jgi:hypothetical protein